MSSVIIYYFNSFFGIINIWLQANKVCIEVTKSSRIVEFWRGTSQLVPRSTLELCKLPCLYIALN